MAFQPTRRRQYKVQPLGVVPMTGLRQLGAYFEESSNDIQTMTEGFHDKRLADLEYDLALKAESTGAIIKDGELQPYAPADPSDIIEAASIKAPKAEAALQKYEIKTKQIYKNAVYVDAQQSALEAYIENSDDPDAINGAMAKYIEGLANNIPDADLVDSIKPDIQQAFANSVGKAKINLKKAIDDKSRLTGLQTIKALTSDIASISELDPSALSTDDMSARMTQVSELVQRRDREIKRLLDDKLIDVVQADTAKKASQTTIATRVATANLERVVAVGVNNDLVKGLEMISSFEAASVNTQDFDPETVNSALKTRFNEFSAQISATTTAQNNAQTALWNDMGKRINSLSLADINEKQEQLGFNYWNSLTNIKKGMIAEGKAADKAANDAIFDQLYASYITGNPETQTLASSNLNSRRINGQLSPEHILKIHTEQEKRLNEALKSNNSRYMSSLAAEMKLGPAIKHPDYFRNLTATLQQKGFVGAGKNAAMSDQTWVTTLKEYEAKYNKDQKTAKDIQGVLATVKNGAYPDRSMQLTLQNGGWEPKFADPTTDDDGLNKSISYALKYRYLPKDLGTFMKSFAGSDYKDNPDYYNRGVQAFDMIAKTAQDRGIDRVALQALFENSGISGELYDIISTAALNGSEITNGKFKKSLLSNDTSVPRQISNILPKGVEENQFFDRQFPLAFNGDDDLWSFILTTGSAVLSMAPAGLAAEATDDFKMSIKHENQIRLMKESHGASSLAEVYIHDPKIKKIIMDRAFEIYSQGKTLDGEKGFQVAIREAVVSLGKDKIGLTEDPLTGDPVFALYPIENHVQANMGTHPIIGTRADAIQHVSDLVGASGFLKSEDDIKTWENGKFHFVPNLPYGGNIKDQTYKVFLIGEDTSLIEVLPNFKYNFETSRQNKVFNAIEKDLRDRPSLYRILVNFDMTREWATESYYNRINTAQQRHSFVTNIINDFNETVSQYRFQNPIGKYDKPLTDTEVEKFTKWFGYLIGKAPLTAVGDDTLASELGVNSDGNN